MRIRNKLNNPAVRASQKIFFVCVRTQVQNFHFSPVQDSGPFHIYTGVFYGGCASSSEINSHNFESCVREREYAPSKLTPSIRIHGFHFGCNYRVASVPRDKIYSRLFLRLPNLE
jgi:hypothetical protein